MTGADDRNGFRERGYRVLPGRLQPSQVEELDRLAARWIAAGEEPFELESSVGYPGAPRPGGPGAGTVRRFLAAYQRDPAVHEWLLASGLLAELKACLGAPPILSLAHHNCLMTKAPNHSSDTPWHRDLRYWSFTRGELVTLWIPLGTERPSRGGLWVVPGSHRTDLPAAAFDEQEALRPEHPVGASALRGARPVELERGDVLLFHCRLLHSASRNNEAAPKHTLVFTFRHADDSPVEGTRSARGGEVIF